MTRESLPLDRGRLIMGQAEQTIKSPLDAVVELVTNSDDAYKRAGRPDGGSIHVSYERDEDGNLVLLKVSDTGGGMSLAEMDTATWYARSASGHDSQSGIRGYFGRGLKEAILAFGEGLIVSCGVDGPIGTRLGYDAEKKDPFRDVPERLPSGKLDGVAPPSGGTTVLITASERAEDRRRVAEPDKFQRQLATHFALRDIWSRRSGSVTWSSKRRTGKGGKVIKKSQSVNPYPIRYQRLEAVIVAEFSLLDQGCPGITVKLWESHEKLEGDTQDPCSLPGFVIRTEGVPVEKRGFMDGRPAAAYLFGEVEIPDIAVELRRDKSDMLRSDRSGIDWRKQDARKIQDALLSALAPYFDEKERELNPSTSSTPANLGSYLRRDAEFLNRLAKMLGAELALEGFGGNEPEDAEITDLQILPTKAKVPPGKCRSFSIYIPKKKALQSLLKKQVVRAQVLISHCPSLKAEPQDVDLLEHPLRRELLCGSVTVHVRPDATVGDYGVLAATCERSNAVAEVLVDEPGVIGPQKEPKGVRGGLFRAIELDSNPKPSARVYYNPVEHVLKIYVMYPGTRQILGWPGEYMQTPEARVLYAELLSEGFCRTLVLQRIERGQVQLGGTAEGGATATLREYDLLRSKAILPIHDYVKQNWTPA